MTRSAANHVRLVIFAVVGVGLVGLVVVVRGKRAEPGAAAASPTDARVTAVEPAAQPASAAADVRVPMLAEEDETAADAASDLATEPEVPAETVVAPAPAAPRFPYGRPTPDWVFEQKYAGMSESRFASAKEEVSAAYALASRKAFLECWDRGNFELVPHGQPSALPGDERIVGGRSVPGSTDTQVARLDVERYPEVYELFYEHLWLSTTDWKP